MDVIFDILFELIVEGSLEASSNRKAPMPLRIIAAIVLLGLYGGIIGFCFYEGIHGRKPVVILIGAVILIGTVFGALKVFRKHRQ